MDLEHLVDGVGEEDGDEDEGDLEAVLELLRAKGECQCPLLDARWGGEAGGGGRTLAMMSASEERVSFGKEDAEK